MTDLKLLMPRYEAYKDSGVVWIGAIPVHWKIVRLKNLVYLNPTLSLGDKKQNQIACFLPMEKVFSNGKVDYRIQKLSHDLMTGFTNFKQNDVIVAKITPCFENGKGACLSKMPTKLGFGSTEFHVLRRKSCSDSKFLYYLTKSHLFLTLGEILMTGAAGQKRVPSNFIVSFPVAAPKLREQTTIANFLDCKTTKIDQAIAIKKKQIQLLKEHKQILIQNAVTKGLDPNVPMRDSGVEWIGEIPINWGVKRLKYILDERKARSETGHEPLFMVSQTHGLVVRSEYHEKEQVAQSNINNKIVYKNDLVFNKLKAHLGVFFKSNINFKGLVSPDYAVYKSNGFICDLKYLEHLFRHPAYIGQFIIRATGIVEGLIRLYTGDLFEIPIPVPPEKEQSEILSHIQTQSTKIDKAIAIQEQMIEKLKEYKATLINSAVTGKIKVPDTGETRAVA